MLEDMLQDMLKFSFYDCCFSPPKNILINTTFKDVTFTYNHGWYLVFEFTLNVTYFRRVIDI